MGRADGKKLEDAINSFVRGNYHKSVKIFRKLQPYYPEVSVFLGVALSHESDKSNNKRSKEYVKMATKNIRNERYNRAQEDLYLALEMDRENVDAVILNEQVKLELSMSSIEGKGFTSWTAQIPSDPSIEKAPSVENSPIAQ